MPMRSGISLPPGLHWEHAAWDRIVVALINRDLLVVIGFCALGLLLTACLLDSSVDPDGLVASLDLN